MAYDAPCGGSGRYARRIERVTHTLKSRQNKSKTLDTHSKTFECPHEIIKTVTIRSSSCHFLEYKRVITPRLSARSAMSMCV
eukprot:1075869-Prymnesium_polylepis.1